MQRDYWHPGEHLAICSIDSERPLEVHAQYNPTKLAYAKQVPWAQQTSDLGEWRADGTLALCYGADQPRTLTLELVFDGVETRESVEPDVALLEALATPIEPGARDFARRRAHICAVVWGRQRKLVCVIESIAATFTVFDTDGTPLRATCTVAVKEVDLRAMLDLERAQNRVRHA